MKKLKKFYESDTSQTFPPEEGWHEKNDGFSKYLTPFGRNKIIDSEELEWALKDILNLPSSEMMVKQTQRLKDFHPEVKTDSVLKNIWWTAIKKYHNRFDY